MSNTIKKGQHPEHEGMKMKAQQEREHGAKYISLEKCSFSLREKEKWKFLNYMAI
jgi:hypothetical protein